jgi:MFS family permease
MAALLLIVYFHGAITWIYLAWLVSGLGMGQVTPTYNTLAMDRSADYPPGVATGSLLLALTWGFALGAPLAGVFAGLGFNEGFDPRTVGLGILPSASREALSLGGILALGTGLVLIVVAGIFAVRMPVQRVISSQGN